MDTIPWGTGLVYRQENMDEGDGVSNIAAHAVTDSCEDLSPVAVHKASAGGTQASIPDDSFSAGNRDKNKVVVGWWVELLGAVFHHGLTHLALIHCSRAAVLSS